MLNFFQKSNGLPRHIAIGDVHGHYEGMRKLVDMCKLTPEDRLYFLGDLIDRGPDSAKVVKWVRENNHPCLMGNHEIMLLHSFNQGQIDEIAVRHWLQAGGKETLESYGKDGVPQIDINWLSGLPSYIDLGGVWLVHAGIDPELPLEKQTNEQFCWVREEFFRGQYPYFKDKVIIVGHTITFTLPDIPSGQVAQGPGWIAIETGAYHQKSGWMTALDITNEMVYQVNVFSGKTRKKPLEQISTVLNPAKVRIK
jgi:serine/threonine protein phosphatase 1